MTGPPIVDDIGGCVEQLKLAALCLMRLAQFDPERPIDPPQSRRSLADGLDAYFQIVHNLANSFI
ncbi:hypothetical protein [Paraburkholderia sediminicola]|uniref:hypothetical protein n=1 Tax=Paraburkholderia sediminicola TaxID=458836 RepID=UPI0038BC02A9